MQETYKAEEIFKQFKEHSISEFFRRNSQMLGYSGRIRSLTTVVHEFSTNALDASEEAGILPEISVVLKELGEDKYSVEVSDNGPGIPQRIVGKALATILAGTKFHRYLQQRGQQGIGAAGCTLFSKITTGKFIHVRSSTEKESYECDITIDIKSNKPVVENLVKREGLQRGTSIQGEFANVKYERGEHGVYGYLKRTALSNPHAGITLREPDGNEVIFTRSSNELPKRPKEIKPHPLGIGVNDLVELAQRSDSRKVSSFLVETLSRVTPSKIAELRNITGNDIMEQDPKSLVWADAENLVKAFRAVKWIAPELDSLSTIGEKQIDVAIRSILNPKFLSVVERRPRVFRGGIPFVVEAGLAYGGMAGKEKKGEGGQRYAEGNVLRFANKVPLLFDGSNCAISEAANSIDWKRYGISNFEEEPVSVFVNLSSVYVPYAGVGKQAIAQEEELVDEIKLALMDCGRILQRYISGVKALASKETKYKTIMRYVGQLAADLGEITGKSSKQIEASLRILVESKYKVMEESGEGPAESEAENVAENGSDAEI